MESNQEKPTVDDCAVFYFNDCGDEERLTHWMSMNKAMTLCDSKTFFPSREKFVLKEIYTKKNKTE